MGFVPSENIFIIRDPIQLLGLGITNTCLNARTKKKHIEKDGDKEDTILYNLSWCFSHPSFGPYPIEVGNIRPVRLAYQPPASSTFLSQQTSHQQPASSTLLSEQTSTSHQPPANRTG
jgi:hypothetical protein